MKKCKHCGKSRGDHNAMTKACPMKPKIRTVGYTAYHPKNVYEEREVRSAP